MRNTLDKIGEIKAGVAGISRRLDGLANAFYATGNEQVANKLRFMAEDLMAVIDGADKAWSADMDEQMAHSSAMMGNILNLALNCDIRPLKEVA